MSNSAEDDANNYNSLLDKRLSRRKALSTAGKAAVGIGAIAVVAAGAGGYYYLGTKNSSTSTTTIATTTSTAPPVTLTTTATSTATTTATSTATTTATLTSSSSTGTGPSAPTTGTITIAPSCCALTLDPHNYSGLISLQVINFMAEPLVGSDPTTLAPAPGLSTAWTRLSPTSYQLTLRQGVTFADGTPFNADAVATNVTRMIPAYVGLNYFTWLQPATVVDEYTVNINSNVALADGVFQNFLQSNQAAIISPAAIAQGNTYCAANCIGTGPFTQVNLNLNSGISMKANPNYWGGAPSITDLTYQFIPDAQSRELSFLAGDLQFIGDYPATTYSSLAANAAFKTLNQPALRMIWWGVNTNTFDLMTRTAFFYAIDQASLISDVFGGLVQPTYVPLPNTANFQLPNDTYGPNGKWPYSTTMATQLLTQAGWTQAAPPTGPWVRNGQTLAPNIISTMGNFLDDSQCAEAILGMLQAIGIQASLTILENAVDFAQVKAADYDTYLYSFGYVTPDFEGTGRLLFHSAAGLTPPRALETTFYDPATDALIDQAIGETDPTVRTQLYAQVQQNVMNWAGFYPICTGTLLYAWDQNLTGIATTPAQQNLSLNQAKAT